MVEGGAAPLVPAETLFVSAAVTYGLWLFDPVKQGDI